MMRTMTTTRIRPDEARWIITRDDQVVGIEPTEAEAFHRLHQLQPQSVSWATTNEGYAIEQAQPWPMDGDRPTNGARQLQRMARAIMFDHGHNLSDRDPLTRVSCAACVLGGYRERGAEGRRSDGPNYAGWGRLFVQAQAPVPAIWAAAFDRHRAGVPYEDGSINYAYLAALERDIATWGAWVARDA